jgi:hypothetical protein
MERFQLWAQPWWVNLLLLVPALSYLLWRRKGLLLSSGTLLTLAWFGASFGFVEAAVVVYLRAAAGVSGQYLSTTSVLPPPETYQDAVSSLAQIPQSLRTIEAFREAATMIMLGSVALLAGARAKERWGSFLFAFAAWDITYYVGLWATLRWAVFIQGLRRAVSNSSALGRTGMVPGAGECSESACSCRRLQETGTLSKKR